MQCENANDTVCSARVRMKAAAHKLGGVKGEKVSAEAVGVWG